MFDLGWAQPEQSEAGAAVEKRPRPCDGDIRCRQFGGGNRHIAVEIADEFPAVGKPHLGCQASIRTQPHHIVNHHWKVVLGDQALEIGFRPALAKGCERDLVKVEDAKRHAARRSLSRLPVEEVVGQAGIGLTVQPVEQHRFRDGLAGQQEAQKKTNQRCYGKHPNRWKRQLAGRSRHVATTFPTHNATRR